jgi:site-specific DNA recombinase
MTRMATVQQRPATTQVTATTKQRAAIYNRVSTLRQREEGYSPGAQTADCLKLAEELDLTVADAHQYEDTDSGAKLDLPGLNAMLDAAKRREFDVLLCWDPDRLARGMAKQLVVEEELSRYGVTIRYVMLKLGDTAEDRLLKNVRASFSEYEREKIRLRLSRGIRAKAELGLVVGVGQAPYGYRYTYTNPRSKASGAPVKPRVTGMEPDPETAPILARIFAEATYRSLNELALGLEADGIPGYQGGRWQPNTLRRIINNPVYTGQAVYYRHDKTGRTKNGKPSSNIRPREEWLVSPVPALIDDATGTCQ